VAKSIAEPKLSTDTLEDDVKAYCGNKMPFSTVIKALIPRMGTLVCLGKFLRTSDRRKMWR